MPEYRRFPVPGGTWFFTVNLQNRECDLLTDRIDALRSAFASTMRSQPMNVIAIVVLPEHLHCVWRLPHGDADNAKRWRRIKADFSRAIESGEFRSASRASRSERGIWQRRFWARQILDERDLGAHIDDIHRNPVKHGWVDRVGEWPHSSFHRYVREGLLAPDWGDP